MIYSDGTTNLVSGSAIVRGTGTKWKSNINGIAAGQIISIQSGNTVIQNVIRSVNSDTELVLAFAPSVSLNNAKYVISTTVPDTVSDGVRHMVAINAYIIQFLQNMDRWMSENGKVEVEMPNGQKVTLDSIRALQAGVEGKLDKFQNGADIPNKPEFVKNLGLAGTVDLAKNALPKAGGWIDGDVTVRSRDAALRLWADGDSGLYMTYHQNSKRSAWMGYGSDGSQTFTISNEKAGSTISLDKNHVAIYGAQSFIISSGYEYSGINITKPSGTFFRLETDTDQSATIVNFVDRNSNNSNRSVQSLPKGFGTIMSTSQYYADNTGVVRKSSP
ncbi:hypothetical protein KKJ24_19800, partial [Xenorhabdus bovienii]|nr:hypothetical protein [Xenorhabdus bovienii]